MVLQNIGILLHHYTASQPIRAQLAYKNLVRKLLNYVMLIQTEIQYYY